MTFTFERLLGTIGIGVAGAFTGASAGVSITSNLGIADLGTSSIGILIGGILGTAGGISAGIATLWSRTASTQQTQPDSYPNTHLITAQLAWALIATGIALPYLTATLLTTLHLSQIGTVSLDKIILPRASGLIGAILWIDGIILQVLTATPTLRHFSRLVLTLLR